MRYYTTFTRSSCTTLSILDCGILCVLSSFLVGVFLISWHPIPLPVQNQYVQPDFKLILDLVQHHAGRPHFDQRHLLSERDLVLQRHLVELAVLRLRDVGQHHRLPGSLQGILLGHLLHPDRDIR